MGWPSAALLLAAALVTLGPVPPLAWSPAVTVPEATTVPLNPLGPKTDSPWDTNTQGESRCFSENQGQVREGVLYYVQAPLGVAMTEAAVLLVLRDGALGHAVRLRFTGANSALPSAEGEPCYETHHIQVDRSLRPVNVPAYPAVRYKNLYDGIDLVYELRDGLKATFHLAPGADPEQIRFVYEGVEGLQILEGDLILQTPLGPLVDTAPSAHQPGETDAVPIAYVLRGHEVGFNLGRYDTGRTLIIDPLVYAATLGGGLWEEPWGLALDATGAAFVIGSSTSTDFPATPGSFNATASGSWDVVVAKLNQDGSQLVYATYLGGSGRDNGWDIAVDGTGHAYVTGRTVSANFPTTPGAFSTSFNGGISDAFVAKLSPDGSELVYGTYLGGSGSVRGPDEQGINIAVDSAGNAYVSGVTHSPDFPTTPDAFDPTYNGEGDAFVAVLSADGSEVLFATYLGGSAFDQGWRGLALNGSGDVILTGSTFSSDFPTTPDALDPTHNGDRDVFIARLRGDGTDLVYASYLGGSAEDEPTQVAVDGAGNAYVSGGTHSPDFPTTPDAFDPTYDGERNGFVAKVSADGNLLYATYLGGPGRDAAMAVAFDGEGKVYVCGITRTANFPVTPESFDPTYDHGNGDAFLAVFTPEGALTYGTFLGGGFDENIRDLAVHPSGNVILAGWTRSSDFPTTPGAFVSIRTGETGEADIFLASIHPSGAPEAVNLTVDGFSPQAAGIQRIVSSRPSFAWTYADPEGADQADVQIRVSSGRGLADVWAPAPAGTSNRSLPYNGPPLEDGREYYVGVRVQDDRGWSRWNETSFRTNAPPPAPSLLAPVNGVEGIDPGPVTLRWEAVADLDGDAITYTWFLSTAPDFSSRVATGSGSETEVNVTVAPETRYYWRVRSWDGWEFGPNGTTYGFSVGPALGIREPVEVPLIVTLSATAGAVAAIATAVFWWWSRRKDRPPPGQKDEPSSP